ncbi:unnamed protein product, partial [Scytosiphon promiscuus]
PALIVNPKHLSQTTRYRVKRKAVEAVGDLVALMGKLNLAPPASVLEVLERALLLTGKAKSDFCDTRYFWDFIESQVLVSCGKTKFRCISLRNDEW